MSMYEEEAKRALREFASSKYAILAPVRAFTGAVVMRGWDSMERRGGSRSSTGFTSSAGETFPRIG